MDTSIKILDKFQKKIWDKYKNYILDTKLPVVITGHSRGAALAEMVHVIAKKYLIQNKKKIPLYCIAHAPPPSMFLTDPDKDELTKDIYGTVNGDDAVPRFFVGTLINILNYKELVEDLAYLVCLAYLPMLVCLLPINKILAIALALLAPTVDRGIDSFILEGLTANLDNIKNILEKYNYDPNNVKIQKHVSTLYQLKWAKRVSSGNKDTDHGCIQDYLYTRKLADTSYLSTISLVQFKKLRNLFGDHFPQYYRHAIQDPLCRSIQKKTLINLEDNNTTILETGDLPSWIPDITDGDDYFTCSANDPSNPKSFIWRNYESNLTCDGKAIDCDIKQIKSIICINSSHYCQWPKSGYDECTVYQPLDPGSAENRCMEQPGDVVYKVSSSYDHSSSGSSSNIKKHSSSGSSNKNGDSCSGSSNRQSKSSWKASNDDYSNDPESCPIVLGNFHINSVYVGGSTLVKIPLAYELMQSARKVAGHIVPPPNFLHTAIWIGSSDASNETLGAIVVYGEYYSNGKDPTYLTCDGARSFVMSLGKFREEFDAFEPMKLIPQRNVTLLTFFDEIQNDGHWIADEYKWTTHNCQHFTATCLNVLKTKRFKLAKYDWTKLPSNIMKAIRYNEIEL